LLTKGAQCLWLVAPIIGRVSTSLGASVHSVKPWRMKDVLGKPLGHRG
jgi:hypothetical protein